MEVCARLERSLPRLITAPWSPQLCISSYPWSPLPCRCSFEMLVYARPFLRPCARSCHLIDSGLRTRHQSNAAEASQQHTPEHDTLPSIRRIEGLPGQRQREKSSKWRGFAFRKHATKDPDHLLIKPAPGNGAAEFSPVLLRDMCGCSLCVDGSTRQKLFSTAEIPEDIAVRQMSIEGDSVRITWKNDVSSLPASHETMIPKESLKALVNGNSPVSVPALPRRSFWSADCFADRNADVSYAAYMEDDAILHRAVRQLHIGGLLFLKDVPDFPESVSRIAERIGPLKNTFYGKTWDVRSVPEAKNVAYTSQDLGFHMDLLYMEQPPHIQLLHCIRSSASGGASLFTDSFRAVRRLYEEHPKYFETLVKHPVTYHYNHTDSGNFYEHSRPVIELPGIDLRKLDRPSSVRASDYALLRLPEILSSVAWSPPFQAPFRLQEIAKEKLPTAFRSMLKSPAPVELLNTNMEQWHAAARKFNDLIHEEEGIYERSMKPGECVLFDNRRVLHARKAFEVGDAGKERWLKGAYIDKDPFLSTLRSLMYRFRKKTGSEEEGAEEEEEAQTVDR